jgi:hypothetical protein
VGFKFCFTSLLCEATAKELRQGVFDFSESADAPFQKAEQSKLQYNEGKWNIKDFENHA